MRVAQVFLFVTLACLASAARAQEEVSGGSFITPFPANDVYQVRVIGDSLADGLVEGLTEALTGDARFQLQQKVASVNGYMRGDFEDQLKRLEESLAGQTVDIAIVMTGLWDRVSIRGPKGVRLTVGSEEWKAEYARRVDQLLRVLKQKKSAVYLVGLPVVRRPSANEDVQAINEILRQRAYLNGQKYLDTYSGFLDQNGGYDAYGPDLTGKIRLLRAGDEFTGTGYRKLAHFVERDLKRDVTTAKAERAIPLAGGEAEQARVSAAKGGAKPAEAEAGANAAASKPAAPQQPSPWTAPQVANAAGDQKADNGKVSIKTQSPQGRDETLTLDLPRPAISATVLDLLRRRESPDRLSQMGDALVDQMPGGITVMSSITPAGEGAGLRRKVSPTQSAFFRVLVRGERIPSKAGRVDDASWPRSEAAAAPPRRSAEPAASEAAPEKSNKKPDDN